MYLTFWHHALRLPLVRRVGGRAVSRPVYCVAWTEDGPMVGLGFSGSMLGFKRRVWSVTFGLYTSSSMSVPLSLGSGLGIPTNFRFVLYHQHHQHFTGFWSCTTILQNCYCQTPAQETLPRTKCAENYRPTTKQKLFAFPFRLP